MERGVAYLKSIQQPDGTWDHSEIGATALAGLALLECEVVPDDPHIIKAAGAIRTAAPNLTHTYSLALGVLFLDRLGDSADVPLIQSLAVRLLAGQTQVGSWEYHCPLVNGDEEVDRLTKLIQQRPAGATSNNRDPVNKPTPQLPVAVQELLKKVKQTSQVAGEERGDNSNTQFAIMGLWVAQRHGFPAQQALRRTAIRFRQSVNSDGGWSYTTSPGNTSSAAMTCAGLLALAMGAAEEAMLSAHRGGGSTPAPPVVAFEKDPIIRNALLALGTAVGQPVGLEVLRNSPNVLTQGHYFLWSLERVAVIYGLRTIGGKDWYSWGAELLIVSQSEDGGWLGEYTGGGVDTSFALLFLRRANLARDLSAALQGRLGDPGAQLQKGGVGGTELLAGKGIKSNVNFRTRPTKTSSGAPPQAPAAAGFDQETRQLVNAMLRADVSRRETLLSEYQQAKGAAYTDALAAVISRLTEIERIKAREALTLRLARMTVATLRDRLRDEQPEIRRAAALAFAVKEDRSAIAALIDLLEDPEPLVARAAHTALKDLTKQDFGPSPRADTADSRRSAAAWRAWWQKQAP